MKVFLVLCSAFLLSGCLAAPSDDFIKALAADPASVCFNFTSVYGTVRLARTNIISGNVSCTNDGLTVKSDAASAGVPITVIPQITIGAPVIK